MTKKILLLSLSILCLIALATTIYAANNGGLDLDLFRSMGKNVKEIQTPGDKTEIAQIDGEPFLVENFDMIVANFQMTESPLIPIAGDAVAAVPLESAPKPVRDRNYFAKILVHRELIKREAAAHGITVSDSEVDELIKEQREALHQSEEAMKPLNAFLEGFGITEEEYWVQSRDHYKKGMVAYRLNIQKRKEFYLEELTAYAAKNGIEMSAEEMESTVLDAMNQTERTKTRAEKEAYLEQLKAHGEENGIEISDQEWEDYVAWVMTEPDPTDFAVIAEKRYQEYEDGLFDAYRVVMVDLN